MATTFSPRGELLAEAWVTVTPNLYASVDETNFAVVAEELREPCSALDEAWTDCDAIVRGAIARYAEINAARLEIGSRLAADTLTPSRLKAAAAFFEGDGRKVSTMLAALTWIVRKGARDNANVDRVADPTTFPGYSSIQSQILNTDLGGKAGVSLQTQQLVDKIQKDPLINELNATDTAAEDMVRSMTAGLYERFTFIYRQAPELIAVATRFLSSGAESARSFADWLESVDTEQDGDFRAYLQMMTTDLLDRDDQPSMLKASLEVLRAVSESTLHSLFLKSLLGGENDTSDPTTQQWLTLMKHMLADEGQVDIDEVTRRLTELTSLWPESLQALYQGFIKAEISSLESRIKVVLQNYLSKQRLHPSTERLDQILNGMVPSKTAHTSKKRHAGPNGARTSGRVTPSARKIVALSVQETDQATTYALARLKQGPEGYYIETAEATDSVKVMIEKYAQRYTEAGLDTALERLVDHILSDPYGPGTKLLKTKNIKVGDSTTDWREGMVRRNQHIDSSGTTAYRTRIVYAVVQVPEGAPIVAIRGVLHKNDMAAGYTL